MKPWMGITPPPRGQGYYPDEQGYGTSDTLDRIPPRDPGKWTDEDRRQYFRVLGRITLGALTPRQVKKLNRIDPTILVILEGLVK